MLCIPIMHLMHAHIVHVHCCDAVFWAFFFSFDPSTVISCQNVSGGSKNLCALGVDPRDKWCYECYDNIIMLCLLCNSVVQALTKRHQKSTAVMFKQFLQYEVLIFNWCFSSVQIFICLCRCFCIYLLSSIWILFK